MLQRNYRLNNHVDISMAVFIISELPYIIICNIHVNSLVCSSALLTR